VSRRPVVRRILLATGILFLLVVAWGALSGALRQIPRAHTPGQGIETAVQLACGLLSLLGVVTCFRWRRHASAVLTAWAGSLATGAGLSALVWGSPQPLVAAAFTAGALLVALSVMGLLRAGRS
jgi:CHASE2 domain-containing sensor protein